MNCESARLLMLFYRPGKAADLAPEDAAAIEGHLAGCPVCTSLLQHQSTTDAAIGRAFRQVTVPAALHSTLLAHAADQAGRAWRQTWLTRTGIAAALLIAGLIGYGIHLATRPSLDTIGLAMRYEALIDQPESSGRVWVDQLALPGPLPEDFDFRYLAYYGFEDLQGVRVPVLEFRSAGGFARVYILRPGQFHTRDATESQTSMVTVRLYRDRPAAGWTVVIVHTHTGNGLHQFLRTPGQQF